MEVPVTLACYQEFREYDRASLKREICEICRQQVFAKDPLKLYWCFKCHRIFCRQCRDDACGDALTLYPREDTYGSNSRSEYSGEKASSLCERCGIACEIPKQKLPQTSKPLCSRCRTPGAGNAEKVPVLSKVEDVHLFYKENAQRSQLYYGDGHGRERRVPLEETKKLLLQSSLMKERLGRREARVQRAQSSDNQRLKSSTSPSTPRSRKSFLFLEAQEGEQCSITVPAGSEPLTWMFNGKVVYRGTCSCYQLTADHDSTGIYMCLARDTLLLTCIVQLKNLGATGPGVRLRPQEKDGLILSPDIAQLSDASPDILPELCDNCTERGDIFESPRKFECISSELGRRVVLTTVVCSCARASFRYVWNCNGQDLPFVNDFITEFEMSSASEGTYLCLAYDWNSNQPVYSSQPFIVKAKEAEVIIDSVEESVPEQCLADDRSALVLRCGTMEQRGRDMEEISVMPRQPLPLPMPLPVPDSEPHPKPSESTVVRDFLRKELLLCIREPNFNLAALALSPSCRRSISEIIRRVQRNLQFASEEEVVMKVIELICCETAKDLIGIRRCEALCYELIISLASDQGNAFHCSKGEAMKQRVPLRPYILEWEPARSQCLPLGEFVAFIVKAYNADSCQWVHECQPVPQDHPGGYFIRVAPDTCGTYQCWVSNHHGTAHSPPVTITMSDERTSSSETAGVCRATYEPYLPSHELRQVAPVEATASLASQRSVMAVSRVSGSDHVAPSSHQSVHHGMDHAIYLCHIRRDEPRFKQPPTQGSPGYRPAINSFQLEAMLPMSHIQLQPPAGATN